MRVIPWCVAAALLCVVVFGDHNGHDKDHDQDGHKHGHHKHDHHPGKGKHHHHEDHHESNKSISFHKITPANSKFAFKLFRQVASENPSDNIFFSPVSIFTAFTMLSLGAKSKTFDQLIEGLGFNISEISVEDIHAGFHHLLQKLNDPNSEFQLNSGNALFIKKDLKLIQKFLDDAKNFYDSEVFSTNFQNSEEAKTQINSYVEKKTNGKIVDLLSSVDPQTALYIINYIYFKGKWEKPFKEDQTKEGDFHVDDKTVVKVPMMRRMGMYNVAFDVNCTIVEIPYKGNATSLFILPKEGKLKQVEESLEKETVLSWKKIMRRRSANLFIPKFTVSATLDLKDVLSKLGITEVFSDSADLSGIVRNPKLKVSKAVHKAVLSVDEKGTEAAAATAIEVMPMSLPPDIRYDRTFLFLILHKDTKSILFLGKITNPTK